MKLSSKTFTILEKAYFWKWNPKIRDPSTDQSNYPMSQLIKDKLIVKWAININLKWKKVTVTLILGHGELRMLV